LPHIRRRNSNRRAVQSLGNRLRSHGDWEKAIKRGVKARDVYNEIKARLDSSFWHHAGHGIGHNGHEAPRIIPGSDDIFEAGDVITLEPGMYSKELHGGIRIEDNYVVHETGLENLFLYPKAL